MKRILVCEFYHETNTFNPELMTLDRFRAIRFVEGPEMISQCRKIDNCSLRGLVDAVEEAGGEVVPSISLFGCSGGRVEDSALEYFLSRLEYYLNKNSGNLDGIFFSLHGATSTESEGDACGVIIERIRKVVGEDILFSVCFDFHANVTERCLQNADIICGYQTYPHLDFYETGHRAGRLGMKKLKGESMVLAAVHLPILTPPSGYATTLEPFKSLIDNGEMFIENGEILDYSIFNVQPWLDISELASSVVVIASTGEAAKRKAESLALQFFEIRAKLCPNLKSVDDIIRAAEDPAQPKPVILADAADSPNGGAIGDSVYPALRVQALHSTVSMALFVKDVQAVSKAFEIGVGNSTEFEIGGKYTPDMPGPFRGLGTVRSLHDGWFTTEGTANFKTKVFIGKSAVVTIENIDFLLCEAPIESGDPQILRHFGIEPVFYDIVVVKANASFRVPYSKIAGSIFCGDTPGVCAANLNRFTWKHIPEGTFPFVPITQQNLSKAKVYR